MRVGKPDFREEQAEKWGENWKKIIFQGGRIEAPPPLYTFLTQIILYFIKNVPAECQKTYNFDIFPTPSQICTSPLLHFGVNPEFDHTPLFVYY